MAEPALVRRSVVALEKRIDELILAVSEIRRYLRRELPPSLNHLGCERVMIDGKWHLVVLTLHCGGKPPVSATSRVRAKL